MADPPSHFFKFIPPGFIFKLSIPESFWKKLNKERCKKAILRRGCHEWSVNISDEGVFGNGWRQFVTENGVQEFDFIVFKHQGNMLFDFLVFDQSACERQYPNLFYELKAEEEPLTESDSTYTHDLRKKPLKNHNQVKKETNSTIKKATSLANQKGHGYFISTMKSNFMKSGLYLPVEFSVANSLKVGKMVLRDDKDRSWKVHVKRHGDKALYLECGFRAFCVENRLKEGDAFQV